MFPNCSLERCTVGSLFPFFKMSANINPKPLIWSWYYGFTIICLNNINNFVKYKSKVPKHQDPLRKVSTIKHRDLVILNQLSTVLSVTFVLCSHQNCHKTLFLRVKVISENEIIGTIFKFSYLKPLNIFAIKFWRIRYWSFWSLQN